MVISFRRSAFRHGVSEERSRYVIEHCPSPSYAEAPAREGDKVLFLWADSYGVPLEVGAIEVGSGDLVVIHAMRMRTIYQAEYRRLLQWSRQ